MVSMLSIILFIYSILSHWGEELEAELAEKWGWSLFQVDQIETCCRQLCMTVNYCLWSRGSMLLSSFGRQSKNITWNHKSCSNLGIYICAEVTVTHRQFLKYLPVYYQGICTERVIFKVEIKIMCYHNNPQYSVDVYWLSFYPGYPVKHDCDL